MRKLALLVLLLAAAVASFAEEKTPVRTALDAWVDSFNTHDVAARKEYLKTNTLLAPEKIERFSELDAQLRADHGKLELVKVLSATDTTLSAELRHVGSGRVARVMLEIEPEAPHKIVMIRLGQPKTS